jgi:branched-chain amino acid transport system permease protein
MVTTEVLIQILVGGLLMGSVYALIAIGFTLIYGVLDVVNFAHGHFVMAAMFVTYLLYVGFGINVYVALLFVIPLFFVLGLLTYRILINKVAHASHSSQMIVTLGLFIFLENLANFIFGGDLRGITTSDTARSIVVGGISLPISRALAAGISLLVVLLLSLFLTRTPFGMAMRAAATNRVGAHVVGIKVETVYKMTFALGTTLAAIAGAVAMPFSLVSPFSGAEFMVYSFAIAIIGGLGSISGALLAGLLIGIVQAASSLLFAASFGSMMVFSILILVLVFRPTGLFGRAPA